MKKLKIAVYSSAEENNTLLKEEANQLGEMITKKGHILVTGACSGISYEVAKSVYKNGGEVIGFSPFTNINKHKNSSEPFKCFSKIIFIPYNYEFKDYLQACYKYRNISSVIYADIVIIINGRMGTLNEFTNSYEFGKKIGVLTNSGGTADLIRTILDNIKKETGSEVIFSNNIKKLFEKLLN